VASSQPRALANAFGGEERIEDFGVGHADDNAVFVFVLILIVSITWASNLVTNFLVGIALGYALKSQKLNL
jgi:hypothetical protein